MTKVIMKTIEMRFMKYFMAYVCSSGVQSGGVVNKPGESIFYFFLQPISKKEYIIKFPLHNT